MSLLHAMALVSIAAWVALMGFRGRFWKADQRMDGECPELERWPEVVAVIPARNEAETVGPAVSSLLGQNYPGAFSLVLVDDGSDDGTAEEARRAAADCSRLTVVAGKPLEEGWTGKLWAMSQGLRRVEESALESEFVLFTDADIAHHPLTLRWLVGKAESERLDLVSVMARLRCRSPWERLLIPSFVFFFQKLYPFSLVNDTRSPKAAAAGGCMLVRRTALARSGGLEAIRGRLIDDCALARRIKRGGAVWLGLSDRVLSLRAYERLGEIWEMVRRTAFTQLGHSGLALAGSVLGMTGLYLVPPAAVLAGAATGEMAEVLTGLSAWLLMCIAYRPTLAFYGLSAWRAPLLPAAALFFTLMTVDSACRHWAGRGGAWKGRTYGPG